MGCARYLCDARSIHHAADDSFVALFSAMATLISLNRKYELVVARSVGVSAWQFLLPACFGALLFGLATIFILNPFAAYGFSKADEIASTWKSGKVTDVSALRDPWLRQKTDDGETIIGAKSILDRGATLADATFIQFDDKKKIKDRYDARTAKLMDGHWELTDVTRFSRGEEPRKLESVNIPTQLRPEYVEEKLASLIQFHSRSCVTRSKLRVLSVIQQTHLTCNTSHFWHCPHC